MDYYEIIADNFQATVEAITLSVDNLAAPLETASQVMTRALLEDRKIVACGNGADAAMAQLFTAHLLGQFEQDRPALPALTLGSDVASSSAAAQAGGPNDLFSRQLRALGQPGDVLLVVSSDGGHPNLPGAIRAAQERNMCVVALSNSGNTQLAPLIRMEDVEIRVDAPRRSQILELQAMAINCLCELLDLSLFGPYNRE